MGMDKTKKAFSKIIKEIAIAALTAISEASENALTKMKKESS